MTGRHSILLAAILWVHAKAASAVSCPEKRLVVNVGKAQVEVAVEGESAFRLSISFSGQPKKMASRMIAHPSPSTHRPTATNMKCIPAHKDIYGQQHGDAAIINTTFGSLSIGDGGLRVYDTHFKTLVHSSIAGLTSYNVTTDKLSVFLGSPVRKEDARLFGKYYGAGYKPGAPLAATESSPSVGNDYGKGAWSWAPQYYNPYNGYGALAVGSHDLPKVNGGGICIGDTTGRQDCGVYGMTEAQCLAKACCWGPTNETLPWCFHKTTPPLSGYPASWKSQDDAPERPGGVSWTVDGTSVDIYLMPAADAYEFRRAHKELTGPPAMIPRYAFGFMAGRWGWKDRADIEEKLSTFRSGNFPIDAFISDFEWFTTANDYGLPPKGSDTYTDFGYNPVTFPSPKEQLAKYHSMGFKFGGIRKPRLGNTDLLNTCRANGWLVPGGVNGVDRNMNYSVAAARKWYGDNNNHYLEDGVDFWWNDEGEVTYFMFDEWNDAQSSSFKAVKPKQRFFSLNRAYTPGMQKYGLAIWTGDISVSWTSLSQQPAAMLNAQLMGMPYVGCDTGGFKGPDDTPELLTRWYQVAALMSIMRVHSNNEQIPHFPFLYGDAAAHAMRKALELRYALIPMLYSLGHHAFENGTPITRPLFMEIPEDPLVMTITDQWLVGTGLMAAPVVTPAAAGENSTYRNVYFPNSSIPAGTLLGRFKQHGTNTWYEFNTSTTHVGGTSKNFSVPLDVVPVFVRAGTILPLAPKVQHTGQLPGGALQIQVYTGADASFTMVEDDGETTAYALEGTRRTTFHWDHATKKFTWHVEGSFKDKSTFKQYQLTVITPAGVQAPVSGSLLDTGTVDMWNAIEEGGNPKILI